MLSEMDLSTKKFNAITLLIISLCLIPTTFANDFIDSAQRYLEKDEQNAALIELKNALKASPQDSTARFLLGKVYLEQGDFSQAELQLTRALKYKYDKDQVVPLIARALINQSKHEDAYLFMKDMYPDDNMMPNDVLALAAMAEVRLKDTEEAKQFLDKITQESLYTQMSRALYSFIAEKKSDEALAKLNALTKTHANNSELWLLKGHIETSLNLIEPAYQSYTEAYKNAPEAHQYNYYIARSLVQLKRFDKADPIINALLIAGPQNPFINELKAISDFAKKEFNSAKLHADKALGNGINNFKLNSISGVSAFYLDQLEHAYSTLTPLVANLSPNHPLNRIYIITQFKLGYIDEAIENLDKFQVGSAIDSEFLSKVSVELSKIGRNDLALNLANKASEKAQGNTETVLNFIKLANNDTSGMQSLLEHAENSESATQIKQGLANYYFTHGKIDEAQETANEWLAVSDHDIVALAMKGYIANRQNKPNEAKGFFKRMLEVEKNNLQALIEIGKIEYSQNNIDEALASIYQAKLAAPENLKVSAVFLQYYRDADRLDEAMKIIKKQGKEHNSNALSIQYSDAQKLAGDNKAAIIILEKLPNKNSLVWQRLSALYEEIGDENNQRKSYQAWLENDLYNPMAYLSNIRLMVQQNKLNEARKINDKATKRFPNDVRFTLIETDMLLKLNKAKEARALFDGIAPDRRNSLEYLRVQGMLNQAERDYAGLVKTNEARFNIKQSFNTAFELASAYLLNDQKQQAITFLDELIRQVRDDQQDELIRIKMLLAELTLEQDPSKSISLYTDVIDVEPKNALALNNLSWLLSNESRYDEACKLAKRAHSIANQSPSIADTYGYCLLKLGKLKEAVNLLQYAYDGSQQDMSVALHLAEALIAMKQTQQANKILASVQADTPKLISQKNALVQSLKTLRQ